MLIVFASLALCFAILGTNAKEVAQQAHGTVVQSQSKDNIVLEASSEQTLITAEIKMYSQDRAAPRWILSASEIETLLMKLSNLPNPLALMSQIGITCLSPISIIPETFLTAPSMHLITGWCL